MTSLRGFSTPIAALHTRLPQDAGGKAHGLARLVELGHAVPSGWVIGGHHSADSGRVRTLLAPVVRDGRRYAVRSSGMAEDGAQRSYVGQFESHLDVEGLDGVVDAVRSISGTDAATAYGRSTMPMGVIVQEMVDARAAGVAFTRNPLTGLAEVVVEAVPGSAVDLVGGTVTPQRWTSRWGEIQSKPTEPAVPEAVIRLVIETAVAVDRSEGPVDLEWAWDGETLWWIQLRPITALDVPVFSNRISREVFPGMIHPLVWSVNVPVVNGAWIGLFSELIGDNDLKPEDLARRFGGRAYFDMRTIGDIFEQLGMQRDLLEVLIGLPGGDDRPSFRPGLGVVRHLPRAAAMAIGLLAYHRRLARDVDTLWDRFRTAAEGIGELDDRALAARIELLMDLSGQAARHNIVTPLLMQVHAGRYRRSLESEGIDPLRTDPAAGLPELEWLDPTAAISELGARFRSLDEASQTAVLSGAHDRLSGLGEFLERFGHHSERGNDFSSPPWREDLSPVLASIAASTERTGGGVTRLEHDRRSLRVRRDRAARWRIARERVSSLHTFGHGLLRPAFFEVGRRFVEAGIIDTAEDILFLELAEVMALLGGETIDEARIRVEARRAEIAEASTWDMPDTIFGDTFVPAAPADASGLLTGVAASRGVHRGPARVIESPSQAGDVEPGDVLVVPFSDVGWTSVFSIAGAVVAGAGGLLSHSSIIARELGIPCVVSVERAMNIPSGSLVEVDGDRGTVRVVA